MARQPVARAYGWWHDDLLAWLCPGGLLLTALMLRFPAGLQLLRERAPELTLPTWIAGAYVLGLALSPLGRIVYALAQAIVWPHMRQPSAVAVDFIVARMAREESIRLPPAATMSSSAFHEVDRRLREYLEAVEPDSRHALNRMKVLSSLSCNAAAACVAFIALEAVSGNAARWTPGQTGAGMLALLVALVAAVYRERRRQRMQLSLWRRLQIDTSVQG
jgi:hypothetical protein